MLLAGNQKCYSLVTSSADAAGVAADALLDVVGDGELT
jgi:hypothetical protein